jgi:UDP-N-acetylglucosamine 4,6-dehydratase
VEHNDRYVILPAFKFWDVNTDIPKDSVPVDDDFLYSSDSNDDWLDAASLGALIGGL